jgi:hypothetical protein
MRSVAQTAPQLEERMRSVSQTAPQLEERMRSVAQTERMRSVAQTRAAGSIDIVRPESLALTRQPARSKVAVEHAIV